MKGEILREKRKLHRCHCGGGIEYAGPVEGLSWFIPRFRCSKCDYSFTCGNDGGEYADLITGELAPRHEV